MNRKIAGFAFVLLSIAIMSVSAYVYEQGTVTVNQTVVNVATLTLRTPLSLASIEEGQTASYTEVGVVTLTTQKSGVILTFDSNIEGFAATLPGSPYAAYSIAISVGGSNVATLTPSSPDASYTLTSANTYSFDFTITATAKSVSSDVPTGATIVVTANSP